MAQRSIIIAIDGLSACGKSTVAKDLATVLRYRHIDSGAMYRAVTHRVLQTGTQLDDLNQLQELLTDLSLQFAVTEHNASQLLCSGRPLGDEIRNDQVNQYVSQVAAIAVVRTHLVDLQQQMGRDSAIVMDGRDIGTVVFPHAELKIFLTADFDKRVTRRFEELVQKGMPADRQNIAENLRLRDEVDSNRQINPLRQADDAVRIDNTNLNRREQLAMLLALARERGA